MLFNNFQWYRRLAGGVWAEVRLMSTRRFWIKRDPLTNPPFGLVVRDEMWLGGLKGLRQSDTTIWHVNHSTEALLSWMKELHKEVATSHDLKKYEQLHMIESELFSREVKKEFLTLPFDCETYDYHLPKTKRE